MLAIINIINSLILLLHWYRYKRVFSVGSKAVTTYNPGTGEITNQVSMRKLCVI